LKTGHDKTPLITRSPAPPQISVTTSGTFSDDNRTPHSGGLTPTRWSRSNSAASSHTSKDGSPSHSSPRCSSIMGSEDNLKERLYRARCECGHGSGKYIVPRDQIELLITEPV